MTESRPNNPLKVTSPALRALLYVVGILSVILGVLGIFLPLLPTTCFLLLAAACFVRSSDRLYNWLVNHPKLGVYIEGYLNGRGIPRKAKYYTLLMLWATMSITLYIVPLLPVRILLALIAVGVSIYIWRMPDLCEEHKAALKGHSE